MKQQKVCYIHPDVKDVKDMKPLANGFRLYDEETIDCLVYDEENPDVVIATSAIYTNKKAFLKFKELYKNPYRVYVMIAEELVEPDMNLFDYGITFQSKMLADGRHGRIPTPFHYGHNYGMKISRQNSLTPDDAKQLLTEKKRFCNFIYSNPFAIPMRERLFYEISNYKRVDSLGRFLKNTDVPTTRRNRDWLQISINDKSRYKFSIAVENGVYSGYTDEKLLTSYFAHTIPIYYGNPDIYTEYNKKSMINVSDYESFDKLIEAIREIDQCDEKWIEMICEPWQTEEQIEWCESKMVEYQLFLKKIFTGSIEERIKRPIGSFASSYCMRYFDNSFSENFGERMKLRFHFFVSEYIRKEHYRPWPLNELIKKNLF